MVLYEGVSSKILYIDLYVSNCSPIFFRSRRHSKIVQPLTGEACLKSYQRSWNMMIRSGCSREWKEADAIGISINDKTSIVLPGETFHFNGFLDPGSILFAGYTQ